jgi:hypothetical protein
MEAARSLQPENAVPAPQSPSGAEASTLEVNSPDTEPGPVAATQASGLGYVAVTPDGMCVGEATPSVSALAYSALRSKHCDRLSSA